MATPVDLANVALARFAAKRITSFADNTLEAQTCARLMDVVRDMALTMRDWRFATAGAPLVGIANTTPRPPWPYVFARPPFCLKPRYVVPASGDPMNADGRSPFEETIAFAVDPASGLATQVQAILTTEAAPVLVYTAQLIDPTVWPPAVQSLFTMLLAGEIAYPITGKQSLAQEFRQLAASAAAGMTDEMAGQNAGVSRQNVGVADWVAARAEWGEWGLECLPS